jgi:glucose/arabinose dehydrogenase
MKRALAAALFLACATAPALAAEPDGLTLPPGFHATVVAEGLGAVRHLAVRGNGDIYLSTGRGTSPQGGPGIIALHLGPDHKADRIEHFGVVDGGTGIRIWHGALYAASASRVYRFAFHGDALVPDSEPVVIVDAIPKSREFNHPIAIDAKGNLFVSIDASANICTAPNPPAGTPPVGLKPCPDLGVRSGIRRFSATRPNQSFDKGEQIATGIRDLTALDLAADGTLYGFMHGRDTTARQFPAVVSQADDDHIADEMAVVAKGADFGWPYSYYDGERKLQLTAPEYGGDGKTQATGSHVTPVLTFQSKRTAPLDMVFYDGKSFPAQYRGGVFIALHGAGAQKIEGGQTGRNVVFVARAADGKFGAPMVFADGFSPPTNGGAPGPGASASYRPVGVAVGPDGALYVAESNKGRVWRIAYGE